MNLYERQLEKELRQWHGEIVKSAGAFERASDEMQKKTQKLVPKKVQDAITSAIEGMVKTMLKGSELLNIHEDTQDLMMAERDYMVIRTFKKYQKTATAQGVGFGMGGILLGMADLPVLMSIKIKFMFDAAKLYGYHPEYLEERLFLLHVFQLAFSGKEHRLEIFHKLEHWDDEELPAIDWEKFQIEYRDYLDLAKMLQLLPVVGGVVGGTANYKLMHRLCENVMNCYRMRILRKRFPERE